MKIMAKKNEATQASEGQDVEDQEIIMGDIAVLSFKIQGVIDLIVHNGQTADPLNPAAKALKEISGKKDKTDADYNQMAEIEWQAGLYLNAKEQPIMPGMCIEAMIVSAAKVQRDGLKAKCGIMVPEDALIIHDGPKTLKGLHDNPRFWDKRAVKIKANKVMRTRPVFPIWAMEFDVHYDTAIFNPDKIRQFLEIAGKRIGMGDFRPRFGRFEVV